MRPWWRPMLLGTRGILGTLGIGGKEPFKISRVYGMKHEKVLFLSVVFYVFIINSNQPSLS